jgi:DNA polymerase elongation subunit (family B)
MVVFHILDAFTQDEEELNRNETTREIAYESEGEVVSDAEFSGTVRKSSGYANLEKKAMVIHLFGVTAEGRSMRADVYGFQPYFYVEVPRARRSEFTSRINENKILKKAVTVSFVEKKVLYGYTGGKLFHFAKLTMTSLAAFRYVRGQFMKYETSEPTFALKRSEPALGVYDANLDPMLRFFHERSVSPCGWVEIPGDVDSDGLTSCEWDSVSPCEKPPLPCSPFLIAVWDIECYSASGNFPVAEAGDPIIQIGMVLVQAGRPTEKIIFVRGTCDEIPGVTVVAKPTEIEVLTAWAAFMSERNPDILVGYNIFGFDERYLWQRAEKLGVDLDCLTRLLDCGKTVSLEEKRLSSSALGDNFLYMWSAHGRVQIDLYHYVKRSFSLGSYKLDSVCQHFMSGKLQGVVKEGSTWILKTKSTKDVIAGRYVVLLDETGDVAVDKLKVVEIQPGVAVVVEAPMDEVEAEDIASAVKWAVVKDDVSPADIFRLDRGSAADRARVAAYCIQDCDLTYELYKKLDVFNNAMAMANTCPVPVSYIFTRGQGIKAESLIYKECLASGQLIKVLPNPNRNGESESYEGAIVLDPEPGFYFDSPVGVADFASLYPSTIESENISHDSLIWVKDYDTRGNFLRFSFGSEEAEAYKTKQTAFTDIDFDIWGPHPEDDHKANPRKIVLGRRVCRYAQEGVEKGTLPTIVRKLLAARKAKRKEAEKEPDPFRKALLDAEQLAYKLTANSLYGQLGSATFKIRLQHLAASVTAYGRKQILFARDVITEFYPGSQIVYGDTDSLFVNFNPRDASGVPLTGQAALEATIHLTEEAGKLVTTALKPPHDFEYDKVFYPFIIFSKKRYVGNKYEEDPTQFTQTSMGIVLKRRDNASVVKTIYGGAIRILLNERNIGDAVRFVKEKTMEMVRGKMSLNQLTISKSLRADYKSVTLPAHKQLANRIAERDPGNAPASGDRIPYVYISAPVGQEASKLQGDRIEHPAFVKANKLSLDTKYYIQHQLLNPLAQLFSLCLSKMPGYRTEMASLDAETAAGNLLFHDALQECENATTRAFAKKFNLRVETRAPAPMTKGAGTKAPLAKTSKQQTIDFYILDKMYLEEQAAKKKKAAAAAKAEAAKTELAKTEEATTKSKKKITIEA